MELPHWNHTYCEKVTEFVVENLDILEYIFQAQRVRRNQIVYLMDDPADRLYIVREGSVRLSTISEDGREDVFRIAQAGQSFGAICLCPDYRWNHQATVHEDGVIASMRAESFVRVFFRHENLLERFLGFFARQMTTLENRVRRLEDTMAQVRLLHYLDAQVRAADEVGDEVRLTINAWNRTAVQVMGVSPQEAEAVLQRLRKAGVLDWKRNMVTVRVSKMEEVLRTLLQPEAASQESSHALEAVTSS